MTPRIIELIIEDDDKKAGLDGIALVENPAHEAVFEYFKDQEEKRYVLSDDEVPQVIQMFHAYGEPQGLLEKEGFYISEVKELGRQEFATILADPNAASAQDTPEVKFRYKYVGPQDTKNRTFCAEMMSANRVFRIEDIDAMSTRSVNPVGPDGYSIFEWRGSYNCRHKWVQLIYRADARIINKGSVRRGVIDEDGMPGPDTRTTSTIAAGNTPPRTGFAADTNPNVSALAPYVDQVTKDVEKEPVLTSEGFESYNDYPESAKNNACKVIKWKEEHGDEVQGMTQVGWIRANQLCKGENISEDTIARMSGFARHKKNAEVSPEFKDTPWKDNGYVAWLGWGGTTGIEWASNKLDSIRNEMSFSVFNADQKLVVGPAMIPDKMIIRRNEITGDIYYVYFTAETIKKLQQKFMKDKLLDATNIEHQRKFLNDVDVVESWIVDDEQKDKQQVFNMNYPKGTWMIIMKVNDDDTWSKVKDGKLKGFSVQGYFLEKAKFSGYDKDILEQIKSILKEIE